MDISVMGCGFVGKWFCRNSKFKTFQIGRDEFGIKSPDVLYLISTVDNYNVFDDPYKDIDTNLTHLIKVLEYNRKHRDLKVINFVSSWFVYGKGVELPAKENACCNPSGWYSSTKLCAENLLISYCKTFGMNYRIFRLANVLGTGDHKISLKKNAFQFFIRELILNRPITIYKPSNYRDFIDVRDVVRAMDLILEKGDLDEIYNIGSGEWVYVSDVLYSFAEKFNKEHLISTKDVPEFHKIVQAQDMKMDISKLRGLGYSPRYTLNDTLDWLMEHYSE